MSRYGITKQLRTTNDKRRLETTIIQNLPVTNQDVFIQITAPERLDQLAYKFYGNADDWWIIATANGLGKGTLWTPKNIVIRIPKFGAITDYIQQKNIER